ncbi:ATP synthase subunit a [Polystyrenella longa]|uniref:ATP synthase subunit a n=1 Tax=Polystyrenella longa TaxID=2528007 RepID=A0A518CHP2_9PLAN|nr:F0F1 ATP synthase subunit A [Polystyrenella longa]QDU78746.1 ATP synthase subunit a [Polystyrenella longa]
MASEDTFHHVRDFPYFELPFGEKIDLPAIGDFQITKFMVLQTIAFLFCLIVFRGLASKVRGGKPVTGWWWNAWEAIALYVRDKIVRPTIGHPHAHPHGDHDEHDRGGVHDPQVHHNDGVDHPADKYLPFIWSCFFYILICNLLGAIPMMGSATGNINVTGVLGVFAFLMTIYAGVSTSGVTGFFASLCPTMDLSPGMKLFLVPMIWVIEFLGFFIKHAVLAIRLFANIMGGHTVLGVMLMFIGMAAQQGTLLFLVVTPASIAGQIGIGLLELLVAFIQAYVFAMLATLFISASVNPH